MSLMKEIRHFAVPKNHVAIWWFGQNGFIFKSPEGTLVSTDLYLTDSCEGLHPGIDLKRRVPVLIEPEELDIDVFTCTHNHQDHTDPETVRRVKNKDTIAFVGPHPATDVYRAEKVEDGRIHVSYPQCEMEFKDVKINGTFALPTDDTDLNHMGFVFSFGNGPRVYVTGDTDYTDLLVSAAKHKPDLVITCINGGFNNLSHWEAADIVGKIKPKAAIPCHYDMFADNQADPKQFRASLFLKAPGVVYQEMGYGKPLLFSAER
ncbi:MAG: MBL fold metallo-hydrolase [Bryobacterales bacterium]|nr:MBL fold metallo-hydrolase [Bryobacterales bacterium]